MSIEDVVGEPDELPQPIVDWQPTHAASHNPPATLGRPGSLSLGAVGVLAFGALGLGALAIGMLAIGRLNVDRARIGRLEVDQLVVGRLSLLRRR